jgi:hypothetical protein
VGFRTLLKIRGSRNLLNFTVFFDVLLTGTCLAPGFYLVRTLRQIYSYDELSMLRYEWIPVLMAGIFFFVWVAESSYFDYLNEFSLSINVLKNGTLFASVSIFAIAVARFAETWGGYVKGVNIKRQMLAAEEAASLEEQSQRYEATRESPLEDLEAVPPPQGVMVRKTAPQMKERN